MAAGIVDSCEPHPYTPCQCGPFDVTHPGTENPKMAAWRVIGACIVFSCLVLGPVSAQEDAPGGRDNPYLSRMPHFFIQEARDQESGEYSFFDGERIVPVRGRLYRNVYLIRVGASKPSVSNIRRHYATAIREMGGEVVFEGRGEPWDGLGDPRAWDIVLTGKIPRPGGVLWVEVWPYEEGDRPMYQLTLVEGKELSP